DAVAAVLARAATAVAGAAGARLPDVADVVAADGATAVARAGPAGLPVAAAAVAAVVGAAAAAVGVAVHAGLARVAHAVAADGERRAHRRWLVGRRQVDAADRRGQQRDDDEPLDLHAGGVVPRLRGSSTGASRAAAGKPSAHRKGDHPLAARTTPSCP